MCFTAGTWAPSSGMGNDQALKIPSQDVSVHTVTAEVSVCVYRLLKHLLLLLLLFFFSCFVLFFMTDRDHLYDKQDWDPRLKFDLFHFNLDLSLVCFCFFWSSSSQQVESNPPLRSEPLASHLIPGVCGWIKAGVHYICLNYWTTSS